jgi:hypothetical protein
MMGCMSMWMLVSGCAGCVDGIPWLNEDADALLRGSAPLDLVVKLLQESFLRCGFGLKFEAFCAEWCTELQGKMTLIKAMRAVLRCINISEVERRGGCLEG